MVSQPIYTGGQIKLGIEANNKAIEITEGQKAITEAELLLSVESAYWQIVQIKEKIVLAQKYKEMLLQLQKELKNAVDQAQRELANRFDFKNTDSSIEQKELVLTLRTSSEDRLRALKLLLEEKLVKRQVSLKGVDWGKIEQASGESVRQIVTVKVGINSDKAREINKLIKEKGPKGVSSQTQGEQIRVTGKKRDDLQETMALLKSSDLEIPLQFENFRD